jgi:hypothetical protein
LDPGDNYFWKWVPSVGRSSGILCGVKNDSLEVSAFKAGRYMLVFVLWDKLKKVSWSLLVAYGVAQEEHNNDFLTGLSAFCNNVFTPYIVDGDFNILRHSGEKNTLFVQTHSSDLFNSIIHTLGLREIFMHGGKFTWSNNHACPNLEKLDMIPMSPDWEDLFPLVTVRKLVREVSDHNALLLDSGSHAIPLNTSREFHFDLSWFKNVEFLHSVALVLNRSIPSNVSDGCMDGQQYQWFLCSSPVTVPATWAVLTFNSFRKGEDGGYLSECNMAYHDDSEMVVALSAGWYNGMSCCGHNIKITAKDGAFVYVMVVDECDSLNGCDAEHNYEQPCGYNVVDASLAVWVALGLDQDVGLENIIWSDA